MELDFGVGHAYSVYPPPGRKRVKVFDPKGLSLDFGVEWVEFACKVFDSGRLSVQGEALYFGVDRLVLVTVGVVFMGAGEFFEEVWILNRGGDFVVAASPFAEVDAAAAVGAKGEVFVLFQDEGATGWTAKGLRHGNHYCRFF
jgi:hypothetical protein